MSEEKIFVLGVGAQKAGTSWLHSYLCQCRGVDMGYIKEYHVWDAVYSPLCQNFVVDKNSRVLDDMSKYRFFMQNNPGFYESFFNNILSDGYRVTGDITPSYSVLSAKQLSVIKQKIHNIGANVKCIFLMRDPVERCWSAAKMHCTRHQFNDVVEDLLRKRYKTDQYAFRTRYERICENLEDAFSPDELYYGFYESMFTDEEITRLSNFIGLSPNYSYRNVKVNATRVRKTIPDDLAEDVRDFYAETYRYCQKNFRQAKELWR